MVIDHLECLNLFRKDIIQEGYSGMIQAETMLWRKSYNRQKSDQEGAEFPILSVENTNKPQMKTKELTKRRSWAGY